MPLGWLLWTLNMLFFLFRLFMSRISCNNIFILVTMSCVCDTTPPTNLTSSLSLSLHPSSHLWVCPSQRWPLCLWPLQFCHVAEDVCHRHSCLARLSLDSFLYFAKSNSSHPLVDLIFLHILSIHVTLVLSYSSLHVHYPTFLIFLKCAGLFHNIKQTKGTAIYS